MTLLHQAEVNAEPPQENKISREETRNPDLSESASPRARAAAMGEDEDEDALPIGKVLIRRGGRPKKRKTENTNTHTEIESENNDSLSLGFGATNPNLNSRVLKRFREGDMVWGKVKSHPWWPGQIYNPAFATASAKRSRRSGHVLVAFFGDATFGWFVESNLVPFEPTYREKSKQTSSRSFCEAVEDAVDEIGRRASLGLMCGCRNRNSFKSTSREGYVQVSVPGWELPVVYPERVLKEAREDFRPEQMIEFVKRMAVAPWCGEDTAVPGVKAVAEAKAYRSAVAVPVNPEYRKALRLVSRSSGNEDDVEGFVQLEDPVQGKVAMMVLFIGFCCYVWEGLLLNWFYGIEIGPPELYHDFITSVL
uniref:PWWP domain-containing protein n=1 Tax=Araucaria cunninghamii TaxID=56994 RepID=A0A0D6R3V8_ARACU